MGQRLTAVDLLATAELWVVADLSAAVELLTAVDQPLGIEDHLLGMPVPGVAVLANWEEPVDGAVLVVQYFVVHSAGWDNRRDSTFMVVSISSFVWLQHGLTSNGASDYEFAFGIPYHTSISAGDLYSHWLDFPWSESTSPRSSNGTNHGCTRCRDFHSYSPRHVA